MDFVFFTQSTGNIECRSFNTYLELALRGCWFANNQNHRLCIRH